MRFSATILAVDHSGVLTQQGHGSFSVHSHTSQSQSGFMHSELPQSIPVIFLVSLISNKHEDLFLH